MPPLDDDDRDRDAAASDDHRDRDRAAAAAAASDDDDQRALVATAMQCDHGRSYDHSDRSMIMSFRCCSCSHSANGLASH